MLGGCSAVRLGYNQGPTLAYWWLDGYFDFTDAQSVRVRDALQAWFAWHRSTELPEYAQLLALAQQRLPNATDPAAVCAWFDEGRRRVDVAIQQAVPAMAEVLVTVTPAQVDHFERRLEKSQQELAESFLQPDPKERLDASVERAVDRVETLYGPVDAAQRRLIVRSIEASPFDAQRWLAERQARSRDMVAALRQFAGTPAASRDLATAQALVRAQFERMQQSPREAYRSYQQQLGTYNCNLGAQLHNATTAAQRQAARAKLKGWEDDVRALMAPADAR